MPTTKYRSDVTIIVRPSCSDKLFPLTAYVAGEVCLEGQGNTVWEAIEDLFTCGQTGKIARQLEREVAENHESWQPQKPQADLLAPRLILNDEHEDRGVAKPIGGGDSRRG